MKEGPVSLEITLLPFASLKNTFFHKPCQCMQVTFVLLGILLIEDVFHTSNQKLCVYQVEVLNCIDDCSNLDLKMSCCLGAVDVSVTDPSEGAIHPSP